MADLSVLTVQVRTIGTCRDCAFAQDEGVPSVLTCVRITDVDYTGKGTPESGSARLDVDSPADGGADLQVSPSFGCVLWETKTRPHRG